MARQTNIRFSMTATVNQTITIEDDCSLTDDEIVAALNGDHPEVVCCTGGSLGNYYHEDSQSDSDSLGFAPGLTATRIATGEDFKVIGTVTEHDVDDAEYSDFELSGD